MLKVLRHVFPDQSPIRLLYHKLMAIFAAVLYGFPANNMEVIAVTGTNGKTSTANILHSIFTEAGKKVGMSTTVNFKIGNDEEVNLQKQSTLGCFRLQGMLKKMKKENCDTVIIEVTSHAMIQSRLWGVNVDTAVFTNLSQDHLTYHGTMDAYKEAKGRLFALLNVSSRKPNLQKISVLNADDEEHDFFARFPVDQMFSFGLNKGTYIAQNLLENADGTKFTIRIPNGEIDVNFRIPGRMNVYNAMAASTVAVAHHINLNTIKSALEKMSPVPGRLEPILEGQPYTVIVDYAHTEDSLEQLLSLFKPLTSGKLIVVFGATGGGRDQSKRPKMGAVVHKYADTIILTDDDPYEEDSNEIAKMVRAGIPREEGDGFWQVLDRVEAIRLALTGAREGDTVIIAGKGAEAFQVVGKQEIPHDDRQVVREILSREIDIEVPSIF